MAVGFEMSTVLVCGYACGCALCLAHLLLALCFGICTCMCVVLRSDYLYVLFVGYGYVMYL